MKSSDIEKAGESPPHLLLESFSLYHRQLRREPQTFDECLRTPCAYEEKIAKSTCVSLSLIQSADFVCTLKPQTTLQSEVFIISRKI